MGPSFFVLLMASALAAGGQVLSKVALEEMSLWNMLVVRNLGLVMATTLLPLRPSVLGEIRHVLKSRQSVGVLILNEGVIAFVEVFLTLWAIDLGPVSLVATLMSTRPLFVFALSVLLSVGVWRLLGEPLDRGTLAIKIASTVMIVGGISAITLL